MAYINPQYQIDMQQQQRMDDIFKGLGHAAQMFNENRRRAVDDGRKQKALELQQQEAERNGKLFDAKMNEVQYQEGQRALDPMMRDDFRQRKAIAEIDAANELKKLQAANANNRALKEMEVAAKGPTLSKAEEAIDKNYAERYNDFSTKGAVNSQRAIEQLEAIQKELENDQGIGEAGGTKLPIPDFLRSSDAIRRRDTAGNTAVTALKEIFGGNPTEGERAAIRADYYNDKLDNKTNASILKEKIKQLKANRAAELDRAKYYEQNRTLRGYQMNPDQFKNTSSDNQGNGTSPWEKYK